MSPWRLWKKHGSKRVRIKGKTFRVFWDLSNAKYMSGPEPYQGFYVAVLCDRDIILLLGDMQREAYKNNRLGSSIMVKSTLLSRKEHLLGKKVYHTRVQFNDIGSMHDITIKCHVGADVKDPWLCIRVDKQTMVHIKQLLWKFRGNQMIYVDGQIIEVLWDAHNWLFDSSCPCAVFMFRTRVQKEKQCLEDRTGTHSSSSILERGMVHNFNDGPAEHPSQKRTSFASILEWPNTHSFKGSKECSDPSPAYSLILYAWRSE
ncbi:hypothetical protein KP509_11G020700 [Ceratopteris richardii]|nr:hypothetical protein KP509_11G020700 [Ceratopteris richardii]